METISPPALLPGFWPYLECDTGLLVTYEEMSSFFREGGSYWLQKVESVMWGGQRNAIMNSFCF